MLTKGNKCKGVNERKHNGCVIQQWKAHTKEKNKVGHFYIFGQVHKNCHKIIQEQKKAKQHSRLKTQLEMYWM
jgi:hypothetical protein